VPPKHIFAVQFDDPQLLLMRGFSEPIIRLVEWFESAILGRTLNQAAQEGQSAYLILDEVQNLREWAPQLKSLVDQADVQVLVTGSSALRIEAGRDSLAGRVTPIEAGVLSLTEIAWFYDLDLGRPYLQDNGLDVLKDIEFWRSLRAHGQRMGRERDVVFGRFSERGGYPLAHQARDVPWGQIADQLNDMVVKRVITHDLRIGDRGRKRDPKLLEETFRLACRYVGQAPSPANFAEEIRQRQSGNIGVQRVRHYLGFLADSLLIRLIEPLEIRLKRSRAHAKICLADHGLRASWLQEVIPLDAAILEQHPEMATLAGRIAESVVGSSLLTVPGLDIAHVPAKADGPEVDFVLNVGDVRIPVEVKYQHRMDPVRDPAGLRAFLSRAVNNARFGLLVTRTDAEVVEDPNIVTLPLSTLLLLR
jgi:predicted AAA+ superfamily ATPase